MLTQEMQDYWDIIARRARRGDPAILIHAPFREAIFAVDEELRRLRKANNALGRKLTEKESPE